MRQLRLLLEKYKAQQDNVRNNREYDVLTKEIEFQSLEIELCEKRIKEYIAAEKAKSEEIEHSNQDLDERKKDLEAKEIRIGKKLFLKPSRKKKS